MIRDLGTERFAHHRARAIRWTSATERLWYWLDAIDAACNRFRDDSELSRLNERARRDPRRSVRRLELALDAALRGADATGDLVDPTVLPALLALGYDRDFDELALRRPVLEHAAVPVDGTSAIHLDRDAHTVMLDPPCRLDLGASAKALAPTWSPTTSPQSGGVVVEIGGDVAVRGEGPEGPWAIAVSDTLTLDGDEPRVTLRHGGIATSSTNSRTWRVGERTVNHIIDPAHGSLRPGSLHHGDGERE